MNTPSSKGNISQYITKGTIGKGTFGKVKLGIHKTTGEKVAIKILEKSKITSKDDMERINREITILRNFSNLNVIKIYDIFETKDNYYILMEYCEKGELFNYIVEKQRLSEEEASYFYYQLINGLEYIHEHNVVHRDLKPENLLLEKGNILKIIDFGLSNYFTGQLLSTPCGSPCYASPEMVSGNKYNGFYIDVWSTGIILYAMICGYLPFEDPSNEILFQKILECHLQYPSHVSNKAKNLMKKILVTDPNVRIKIEQIKKHPFYLQGEAIFKQKHPEYAAGSTSTSQTVTNSSKPENDSSYATKPYVKRKVNLEIKYTSNQSNNSVENKEISPKESNNKYNVVKTEYEADSTNKISNKIGGAFYKSTLTPKNNALFDFHKSTTSNPIMTNTTPLLKKNTTPKQSNSSTTTSTNIESKKNYSKASTFTGNSGTRLNTEHDLIDKYIHTSTNISSTTKNSNYPMSRRINTNIQRNNDYNSFRSSNFSNILGTKKDNKTNLYSNSLLNPTKILFNYNSTATSRLDFPSSTTNQLRTSSHVSNTTSRPLSSSKPTVHSYATHGYTSTNYEHQIKEPNSITINNPTITVYNLEQNIFLNSPNSTNHSRGNQITTNSNYNNIFKNTKKDLATTSFNSTSKKKPSSSYAVTETTRYHSSSKRNTPLASKYLSGVLGNTNIPTSTRIKDKLKLEFNTGSSSNSKTHYSGFNSNFNDKYIKTEHDSYTKNSKQSNPLITSNPNLQPKRYLSSFQRSGYTSKGIDSSREAYNLRLNKLKSQANNMGHK